MVSYWLCTYLCHFWYVYVFMSLNWLKCQKCVFFCVFILPCFQLVLAWVFGTHLCTYFVFCTFLFYIFLIPDTFCFVSDFCTVRTHFFVLFFVFFQISCSLIELNGSRLDGYVWFLAVWVSSGHRFTLVVFALLVLFWSFLVLFMWFS